MQQCKNNDNIFIALILINNFIGDSRWKQNLQVARIRKQTWSWFYVNDSNSVIV